MMNDRMTADQFLGALRDRAGLALARLGNEHRFADRELLQPENVDHCQHLSVPLLSLHLHLFFYSLHPLFPPLHYCPAYLFYALLASLLILFRHRTLMSQYGISP